MGVPENATEPTTEALSQEEQDELNEKSRKREAAKRRAAADAAHKHAIEAKKEYKKAKVADPRRLGFLRLIEVMLILEIVSTISTLVFSSRDLQIYDTMTLIGWYQLIANALIVFMIALRLKITRPVAMVAFGLRAIFISASLIASGSIHADLQSVMSLFSANVYPILMMVYFGTSERCKKVLINDLDTSSVNVERGKFKVQRKGWPFIRNLAVYFCVFSVLGHWMEAAMCQLIRLGLVQGEYDPTNTMLWRDWFYPFPMEGLAVVLIAVLLYPLKEWLVKKMPKPWMAYVLSFIANALTCSAIELSMGLIVNSHFELWNYSDMPFNIMGQVCLQNALAFGAAASIIAWFVYPLLEYAISRVPRDVMNIIAVAIIAGYSILQSLYLISPPVDASKYSYDNAMFTAYEYQSAAREEANSVREAERKLADIPYLSEQHAQIDENANRLEQFKAKADEKYTSILGADDMITKGAVNDQIDKLLQDKNVPKDTVDQTIDDVATGKIPPEDYDKVLNTPLDFPNKQ